MGEAIVTLVVFMKAAFHSLFRSGIFWFYANPLLAIDGGGGSKRASLWWLLQLAVFFLGHEPSQLLQNPLDCVI